MKIRGNTIGTTMPRPDWKQFDPTKADYIKNRPDVANAIKGSVSGNPIIVDDVSPIEHILDIKTTANETVYVRGKNLIPFDNKAYNNGKYVAGQTYTMNNVDFTINDDGSVTLNGTSTAPVVIPLIFGSEYKTGIHTVTLSGSPEGASSSTYCLRLEKENMVGAYGAEDYGNGKTIENVDLSGCSVNIVVINGKTIDATFYPMLEFGDEVRDFVSPCDSVSVVADENGNASVMSVAESMSIYTETNAEIECVYNNDTNKVVKEQEVITQEIQNIKNNVNGVRVTYIDLPKPTPREYNYGTNYTVSIFFHITYFMLTYDEETKQSQITDKRTNLPPLTYDLFDGGGVGNAKYKCEFSNEGFMIDARAIEPTITEYTPMFVSLTEINSIVEQFGGKFVFSRFLNSPLANTQLTMEYEVRFEFNNAEAKNTFTNEFVALLLNAWCGMFVETYTPETTPEETISEVI